MRLIGSPENPRETPYDFHHGFHGLPIEYDPVEIVSCPKNDGIPYFFVCLPKDTGYAPCMLYLATKLGDVLRANVGIHIFLQQGG